MAAVVRCDCCCNIVPYKHAKHLRVHRLADTASFMNRTENWFDLCDECCDKLLNNIKTGGTENDN